jgi:hypothetical protein
MRSSRPSRGLRRPRLRGTFRTELVARLQRRGAAPIPTLGHAVRSSFTPARLADLRRQPSGLASASGIDLG